MTPEELRNDPEFQALSLEAQAIVLQQVSNEAGTELGAPPPLTDSPTSRFISGAITEPLVETGGALASGAKSLFGAPAADEHPDPVVRLLQSLVSGAKTGATDQFTKMFEQYDKGGLSERGPNGSLSPVGRGIAGLVPLIGPMVAGNIDRGASGDVAGAAGATLGLKGIVGGEILRALPGKTASVQAGRAERAAVREAGQVNTVLGTRPRDYAGGRNPAAGAIDEGVTPRTPTAEANAMLRKGLDRTTAEKAKLIADADASGVVVAAGPDVARSVIDAFTERMNAATETFGPKSRTVKTYKTISDNLTAKATANPTFSASGMQKLLKQIQDMKGQLSKKSPVHGALDDLYRDLDGQFDKGVAGMDDVNTVIRDRAAGRASSDVKIRTDQAAHGRPPLDGAELLRLLQRYGIPGLIGGGGTVAGGKLMYDLLDRK